MLEQSVRSKNKLCLFMMLLSELQNGTLEKLQARSSAAATCASPLPSRTVRTEVSCPPSLLFLYIVGMVLSCIAAASTNYTSAKASVHSISFLT